MLRGRIVADLSRILRTWVLLAVGLLGLLAVGVDGYDAVVRLNQESELVATKLRADVDNVVRQLQSLAGSPLLWTGLTDSYGRESYLRPLLARFNAAGGSPIVVLDYRGCFFLGTSSPAGFILSESDPDAALQGLPLREGLAVALATVAQPRAEAASAPGWLRFGGQLRARQQPLRVELRLMVSRRVGSVLGLTLGIVALTAGLGLWLVAQLKGWAQGFAEGTARRLEKRVAYCRDIVAGRPVAAQQHPVNDEISAVFEALEQMTGFTRQELLGQSAGLLYQGEETDRVSGDIRRALAAEPAAD